MSNITNLNRDYLIKINVKEATIDVPKMTFWNTDKKTSNMFVQLVINMSTNELISQYVTVQNATDYKITLNVIKPKTKQYKTIEATLLNEEKALFEIDLPDEFTDQVGDYSFEFEVSSKVDSNDESITTSNGTYKVNGSILTNLNEETSSSPDLPILKQLIEQVKSLQGGDLTGYQKKSDNSLETTSKEVVGAINEVNSQFKDIANLSLVKHTDGKVYIKKQDGTLLGTGIEVGSDVDLSKISMSMNGQTLKLMNNGEQIATVDIPTSTVTDEQVQSAVNTYLTNNPVSAVAGTQDINIIKWKNKKILVDGSSITQGGTGQTQPTWHEYIKRIFGLNTVYNHSVSGTPWFDTGSSNVWTRSDDYETDADAIILMGDYNGVYSGNTLGAIDDTVDTSSYYGKLKKLAEKLINKYPLCPIIWVSEPPRASKSVGDQTPINYNSTYNKMNKAMEDVCKLYGFGYCNLMTNTVFRPWIEANYNETTSDGTHPWNIIQGTMAQIIAETMKTTPLIYTGSYDMTSGSGDSSTTATLESLDVTFTQGDTTIYQSTPLNDLKQYLVVVAVYSDGSRRSVTSYTLEGTLVTGTSNITVKFNDKSATFAVVVTEDSYETTIDGSVDAYTGKILNQSGELLTSANFFVSPYIELDPTQPITLTWSNNGMAVMIAYYDSAKATIGTIKASYGQTVFNIPTENQATTKYIRVVGSNSNGQHITYTRPH